MALSLLNSLLHIINILIHADNKKREQRLHLLKTPTLSRGLLPFFVWFFKNKLNWIENINKNKIAKEKKNTIKAYQSKQWEKMQRLRSSSVSQQLDVGLPTCLSETTFLTLNFAWSIWHHTRAHTYKYCMRQYLSQVSSSYVPDGVSPIMLALALSFAHTRLSLRHHELKAVGTKHNLYISASIFAYSNSWETWCSSPSYTPFHTCASVGWLGKNDLYSECYSSD